MRLTKFIGLGGFLLAAKFAAGAVWAGFGAVEFRATLPSVPTAAFEPLLSVGTPGAGEVVMVRRLASGAVCFGWEQTGAEAVFSSPVNVSGDSEHTFQISLGSLWPKSADVEIRKVREWAVIQIDGRTVLSAKGKFSTALAPAVLGKNIVGGSLAEGNFSGKIGAATLVTSAQALLLAAASLAPPPEAPLVRDAAEYPGPVRISVMLPQHRAGQSEPLVVSGVTGAGDLIYVRYVDGGHLRIGFDHWLKGGPLSEPVACDYDVPHELLVSLGSLLPPVDPQKEEPPTTARLRTAALVQFDGKAIVACASAFYPTKPEQITLGANRIGASTAESAFGGQIMRVERVDSAEVVPLLAAVK